MQQQPVTISSSDATTPYHHSLPTNQVISSTTTTTPLKTTTCFENRQEDDKTALVLDDETSSDGREILLNSTTTTTPPHPSVSTHPMTMMGIPQPAAHFQIPKLALSNLNNNNFVMNQMITTPQQQQFYYMNSSSNFQSPNAFHIANNNYPQFQQQQPSHNIVPNTSPNSSRSHHSSNSNNNNTNNNYGFPPPNHYGVMYSTPSPMSTSRRHRYMNNMMTTTSTPSSQRFSMTSPMSHRHPVLMHSASTPSLWRNVNESNGVHMGMMNMNNTSQQPVMYVHPPHQYMNHSQQLQQFQPQQQQQLLNNNSFQPISHPTTPDVDSQQLMMSSLTAGNGVVTSQTVSSLEEHAAVDALCERQFDRLFNSVGALLDESEREVEHLRMWNEKACEEIDFLNQVRDNLIFQCEELTKELETEKTNMLSKTKEIETIKFDLELKNLENRNFERQIFTLKQQIVESLIA
ncbi:hypothetical protein C9374_007418 [Naegleria lovaniensis]|uniref:Uncharacterized protein n=1 Tax=Naegleria lovaniensis TaxID=51637 RepID=A0AA88GKP6_NAELO|nr:uncharacterized protein C9374_007418 [Naegleria lovaniensis]KAG2379279.1 hypothetical protein C9374_007418 [Naegleria lovaniensis]